MPTETPISIIDDDKDFREAIARLMKSRGFTVEAFGQAQQIGPVRADPYSFPDLAGPAARCATPIPATTKSTDRRRSTGANLLTSRLAVADAPAP